MYDIVFVDIPSTHFLHDNDLEQAIKQYRNTTQEIINEITGADFTERKYFYSMGILCLSTVLKKNIPNICIGYLHTDINIELFDSFICNTKIVAFSTMTVTINRILFLARKAKMLKPDIRIILGGYHATYQYSTLLKNNPFLDCISLYEGEYSILSYVRGDSLESIPGIAYLKNNEVIVNPIKSYLKSCDIPAPDYSLIQDYINDMNLQLSTMRGCIGSCKFCVNNTYWGRIRRRDVKEIVEELSYLKDHTEKGRVIHIIDNIFTIDSNYLLGLYNEMKRHKLIGYFRFECDSLSITINEDVVNLIRRLGIMKICFGVEDCINDILLLSNKPTDFESNLKAASLIKLLAPDICTYAYWLIGLPGTTPDTIRINCEMMEKVINNNIFDVISPKLFIPYPGTPFFENANDYGIKIISCDWDRYERRTPPFPYIYENIGSDKLYDGLLLALKSCLKAYDLKERKRNG